MSSEEKPNQEREIAAANPFTAADVAGILRQRHWLGGEASPEQHTWCARAAALLGPHAADQAALAELLGLVFAYDAVQAMCKTENHVVMSRYAARDVLRQLALFLLEGPALTPERFQEIVTLLKARFEVRGWELFHPLRLALAGRAGEGALDRVILLVDEAAAVGFAVKVKTVRERVLEFCAALD
jgi:hypothetical protein